MDQTLSKPEPVEQLDAEAGCSAPSCSPLVAALFARKDSIYKEMAGVDVWDIERDALQWPGGNAVVAHPPCRSWSQLRHFAKPRPGEKELAPWAVEKVRMWGGVLEHPAGSALWPEMDLPRPGARDEFGGWTLAAPQMWWGHWCEKPTRLYIVGCEPAELPEVPLKLGEASHVQTYSHKCRRRPQLPPSMREKTPPDFAKFLVTIARIAERKNENDLGQIRAGHVCKHGVRWPHKCRPCADAAWIRHQILSENDLDHPPRLGARAATDRHE